jgi:hypothetical protein
MQYAMALKDVEEIMLRLRIPEWKAFPFSSAGYPVPTRGIRARIAMMKKVLMDKRLYSIGRWGSHAYFNADHCVDEARNVAAVINGEGNMSQYLWSSHYYKVYQEVPETA